MQATTKAFLYTALTVLAMLGLALLQARLMPGSRPGIASASAPRASALSAPAAALILPVEGGKFVDTWGAARAAGRVHEGVDIMAPAGALVRAAAPGAVMKLFNSERGGITLYQASEDGRYIFYYAHLKGYAPGLSEGDTLARGQVLGYVGMTGNAPVPHLHFEIQRAPTDGKWWRGEAFNAYPSLVAGRIVPSRAADATAAVSGK